MNLSWKNNSLNSSKVSKIIVFNLFFSILLSVFIVYNILEITESEIIIDRKITQVQDLKSSSDIPKNIALQVESGDTFSSILSDIGIDKNQIGQILDSIKNVYDIKKLSIGQGISIDFEAPKKIDEKFMLTVSSISFKAANDRQIEVVRSAQNNFIAKEIIIPLERKLAHKSASINSSLVATAMEMGLPINSLNEVVKAFSYDLDFQRDIKAGNNFDVLYEKFYDEDGNLSHSGDIIYASIDLGDKKVAIYRYQDSSGNAQFYNEDGKSIKKELLRTPINVVRISSSFGMRHHPVLGYSKMHKGVDFAAPIGTPILSAGNGVVEEIGRKGAYGNYIRIRHNGQLSTAYAHASRFASSLKKGSRVKQGDVVAYVGATGRATGPHLHYEVLVNKTQINPLSFKITSSNQLPKSELVKFKEFVRVVNKTTNTLENGQETNKINIATK